MTAEQIHGSGPEGHDLIHLGGETAVVVPIEEYRRLRALERRASAQDLADAEDEAALEVWKAREAAGLNVYVPADEVRARLGLPTG
ncbi:hypothetical protein LO762_00075 [Actinocorallia sp. API 0066]|uniref:hypothetical protein n=1 Tax=Actinocorallia sp. API 0066 TaxID=2896846 RepID=UPI001E3CD59C|nr:hypothetical protein [Actinocorallia sp. API 0066]MCD0447600.1 hypothetical protein [Actinocorallia sp. API 0066]